MTSIVLEMGALSVVPGFVCSDYAKTLATAH